MINTDFDVKLIASNLRNFTFEDEISVQQFTDLIEHVDPCNYIHLMSRVLPQVNGDLSDDVMELLLTSNDVDLDTIVSLHKFSPDKIQYLIVNYIEKLDIVNFIHNQALTFEQFVYLINNGSEISPESLGSAIGNSRKVEYAKYVVQNWKSIKKLMNMDISYFQFPLFEEFGSVLISDADSIEIFGFARPSMSSEELRTYEPCGDGWRRTCKWAGRTDTKYTWNEFIARHVLANPDNVEDAKNDLVWLAEAVRESNNYFSGDDLSFF